MTDDKKWMRSALVLAARGRGRVHPNPMVGAVVVKGGRCIAEGFHRGFGLAHAEAEALAKAGANARGATLYVTLEPCTHWGKTPPCAEAVLASGVRRVVIAMRDPNPRVSGGGIKKLKRHGLRVEVGVLEAEARELNRAFTARVLYQRPYVILKAAVSLDGRSATVTGESKWITGEAARAEGHRLRAGVDAIAVGIGTVKADNPRLTAHGKGHDPVRIVFDSGLEMPPGSAVLNRSAPTWIITTALAPVARRKRLARKGVRLLVVPATRARQVDLPKALELLSSLGVGTLLVEGGATLREAFISANAVDEVVWFVAPKLLGGAARLSQAVTLSSLSSRAVGNDILLRGLVNH